MLCDPAEADPELTEADKGLGRLQAQRVKEARVKQKRECSNFKCPVRKFTPHGCTWVASGGG